ncbi:hypothetical protein NP493_210g03034 [Ridgeia piscesae]|uniref:Uncharacterized protein n=1 Tax=Ridgeia piscesae TaxID=27915 RepID=A0AAD9P1B5_RIDPI|nr:hypothetical protein NP493_210g03034 [Ridgeia piscesae]
MRNYPGSIQAPSDDWEEGKRLPTLGVNRGQTGCCSGSEWDGGRGEGETPDAPGRVERQVRAPKDNVTIEVSGVVPLSMCTSAITICF